MTLSVCMACFNGQDYIEAQIISILEQLNIEDELIISDDGSTDSTLSLIAKFEDSRIKLLHGPQLGVVENFKNAVAYASGKIIFLSDQDDIWIEGRITSVLEHHKFAKVVAVDLIVAQSDKDNLKYIDLFSRLVAPANTLFRAIFKSCHPGCSLSFSREYIPLFLNMDDLVPMHDWALVAFAKIQQAFHFESEPKVIYRRHCNNLSESGKSSTRCLWTKVTDRLKIFVFLIKSLQINS